MWLVLSLIAFSISALLLLSISLLVRACLRVLTTEPHDVFSPTRGSDNHQSPRE